MDEASAPRAHEDLLVRLAWGKDGAFVASATWRGEAFRAPFDVNIDEAVRALRAGATSTTREITKSRVPRPQTRAVASETGAALFNALFSGEMGRPYALSRHAATAERPFRLVLLIDADELGRVPWELLFDPRERRFLASNDSVIRRPAKGGRAVEPPRARGLHITWVAASPADHPTLDLEREREVVNLALAEAPEALRPSVEALTPPTPAALIELLQRRGADSKVAEREAHILHFACHGDQPSGEDKEGLILLCTPDGASHPVPASTLADAVRRDPSVRLVVLNACNGSVAASHDALTSVAALLSARGVPAVIGMQTPILDAFAVALTGRLYAGIARGEPADEALRNARSLLQVEQPGWIEQGPWASPVLWLTGEGGEVIHLPPAAPAPDVTFEAPPDIVILSAREDEEHRRTLAKFLAPMLKQSKLTAWDASKLPEGADAEAALAEAVGLARMVLLLVSNDYLADPLREKAEAAALARVAQGVKVLPVYVRPIDAYSTSTGFRGPSWQSQPFGRLVSTPAKNNKAPISERPDRDAAWSEVAATVRAVLGQLKPRPAP